MVNVRSLPFTTNRAIACRDTLRTRAASAWVIQSAGLIEISILLVDIVNQFIHI
jgi:hypothetical protein